MRVAIVLVLAGLLSWVTYWRLERLGARARVAALARAVAWAALGLLLLDVTCATPAGPGARPLVLLDGSLSMTAAGGRWAEARDSARRWGEVRLFGDTRPLQDSLPGFGRSDLAPALAAAAASERPVLVVSDGEITDPTGVTPDMLGRVGVRLFPRAPIPDLAITRLTGPDRVTAGDTIRLEAEVRAYGLKPDSARLEVRLDERVLVRRAVRLGGEAAAVVTLPVATHGLAGAVLLSVTLAAAHDAEPRDDARLWLVEVTPTPGVVMLASPTDWDGRFLFRALRDVAQLPLRGYTRIEPGRWRTMENLKPVSVELVAQAARQANVLVLKGAAGSFARDTRARGVWLWPSGEGGETLIPGEWYAVPGSGSPVAGAFLGLPVDSFPPLIQITPIEPASGDWVGLAAQLSRRGADHPVLIGRSQAGRRTVSMAADGIWRWAFRGGSSEQAYRALVASTLSWLLGGRDTSAALAEPVRPVVPAGRPVVFEWRGAGLPRTLGISVSGAGLGPADSLRFDGAGRAELWLAPGPHRYQLEGGGAGLVAVDTWSEEWLPRPVTLSERPVPQATVAGITSSRQWIWLFGIAVVALCVEWLARRRLGLR